MSTVRKTKPEAPAAPKALAALERAAKNALARARKNGTPCYVQENGKIVDLAKAKRAVDNSKRKKK